MTSDKNIDLSRRIYASLMRLYPQEFRDEYSSSMLQLFTDQCRSTMREKGPRGMILLWFRTLIDLVFSVFREHINSPTATSGLLEAMPNKPLPWKGVALVLIPCLVFFLGQIGQLTGQDWFFLLVYRAAYFLIIPVQLVWLLTRKFPIWGLIPLGMFYRTILDLSTRLAYLLGKFGFLFAGRLGLKFTPGFIVFLGNHIAELQILITTVILGTSIFLIIRIARHRGFTRSSWVWLGVFLAATLMETLSGLIWAWNSLLKVTSSDFLYFSVPTMLQNAADSAFSAILYAVGFLLLILVGDLLTRRHGRLALLLPLGYIIPMVVLGRYDNTEVSSSSLFWISLSVLTYRILVTLIAPIWIVRSASDRAQRRAGAIAFLTAIGILLISHIANFISYIWVYDRSWYGFILYYSFSPDLIILAGIALAIALYESVAPAQPIYDSAHSSVEMTGS